MPRMPRMPKIPRMPRMRTQQVQVAGDGSTQIMAGNRSVHIDADGTVRIDGVVVDPDVSASTASSTPGTRNPNDNDEGGNVSAATIARDFTLRADRSSVAARRLGKVEIRDNQVRIDDVQITPDEEN